MRFAYLLRTCSLVGTLAVAVHAADQKALIGATRDQVLARFGDPKSNIVAGRREVLFFTGERIVLLDGRVIEAEEVAIEPPSPPPAPIPPPAAPDTSGTTAPAQTDNATPESAAMAPSDQAPATISTTPVTPAPVAPPPPPEVIIKSIRPPSASAPSVAAVEPTPPAPQAPAKPATQPEAQPALPAPSAAAPIAATPAPSAATPAANGSIRDATSAGSPASTAAAADVGPSEPSAVTPAVAVPPRATRKHVPSHGQASVSDQPQSYFTGRTYLIALVTILGGVAYLVWRMRQRKLLLQVSAVSRSPFAQDPHPPAGTAGRFTADLLEKLEWKRFEELVAAYYNKTGVVAVRTKTGPTSGAQIRISWKGEQRPFACVRCLPHPGALIDATPIEALCQELDRENVRRGYVVTTGKFSVPARDLAEEKHVTLLSGDIFLEKLNALPDAARSELLRDATAGDYSTPSCPTCDAKMTRATYDGGWQCPQCSATLPRGV